MYDAVKTKNEPVIPTASDSLEAEFTVSKIINEEGVRYTNVKINKIISYNRDKNAYYDAIEEGDTVKLYLPFGDKETETGENDAFYGSVLEGLNKDDKARGAIAGCPDKCNGGGGWALFLYKIV